MSSISAAACGALALLLAATPSPVATQLPHEPRGLIDATELEAWVDGYVGAHLQGGGIAGAGVAIVRDGEIPFSKGYGFADVARRTPVSPATTLFRIGSVSKLFTWTAVMQLRDEGLLDLDEDVDSYLDFPIPTTYPEPITLRHLLTHTAGLEDRAFGLFGPPSHLTRSEWMRRNLPARVRPPGVLPAYSNYGSALAGYIVERASGIPWEEYLEQRILGPLGMDYATGRQPLPADLARHMSTGYRQEGGRLTAKPFEWIEMAPAGSIGASAGSMAAFMLAHLQGGLHRDVRILADATAREMHARAFASDPRINGMALGFYERSSHGLRAIGHSGGTQWFFTDLVLIPAEGLGIFISTNSAGDGGLLAGGFADAFLDRYYPWYAGVPSESPAAELEPGWNERARAYAGTYRPLRRSYTTFEKFISPMFEMTVDVVSPGGILVRSLGRTHELREVGPGYFRSPDGPLEAVFADDGRRRYSHLFLSTMPPTAAERIGGWQSARLHFLVATLSVLVFVSGLVFQPIRYVLQRSVAGVPPLHGMERGLRWAATCFSLLCLTALVVAGASLDSDAFVTGEAEDAVRAVLTLFVAAVPFAVVVVAGLVVAIQRRYWSLWGRVHYAIFATATVTFMLQLSYWNLLGWLL